MSDLPVDAQHVDPRNSIKTANHLMTHSIIAALIFFILFFCRTANAQLVYLPSDKNAAIFKKAKSHLSRHLKGQVFSTNVQTAKPQVMSHLYSYVSHQNFNSKTVGFYLPVYDVATSYFAFHAPPSGIYIGDSLPRSMVLHVVLHEYGHFIYVEKCLMGQRQSWASLWQDERRRHTLPNLHAAVDPMEGFAEAFYLWLQKDPKLSPASRRFMDSTVKNLVKSANPTAPSWLLEGGTLRRAE